ncbi:hypothetical protein [Spirillospora albida]|uniref:hypothetical protein n=1 Tax=Spirillospora albida TaxID=58123 RepID=UPI0012FA21FC|nr:hypothetical protein [Spirillospora albida]
MSDKDLPGGQSPAEHEAAAPSEKPERPGEEQGAAPTPAPASAEVPPAPSTPSGPSTGSRWSRLRRRTVLAGAGAAAGLVLAGGAGGFVLGHVAADDGHRGGGAGHVRDVRHGGEGFHGPMGPGGHGLEDRQGRMPREETGRRDGGQAPGGY